ncbi:hypothetical protein Agabi119p4_9755 [Agaricus bisporus var. burnettii]|uniref:Uncharacterized protein n=1 Tax=Agaricus bisporus var. burnettii TaxID=192524 RepID=A0A8H7C493_AGABI|nr:hypothetical protein Agabi119p4_9755 [Agaricus bisporus var. burnettii]
MLRATYESQSQSKIPKPTRTQALKWELALSSEIDGEHGDWYQGGTPQEPAETSDGQKLWDSISWQLPLPTRDSQEAITDSMETTEVSLKDGGKAAAATDQPTTSSRWLEALASMPMYHSTPDTFPPTLIQQTPPPEE